MQAWRTGLGSSSSGSEGRDKKGLPSPPSPSTIAWEEGRPHRSGGGHDSNGEQQDGKEAGTLDTVEAVQRRKVRENGNRWLTGDGLVCG